MVADPAETPVTTPPVETVATPVALLLQVPEAVASVRVMVLPVQTDVTPPIAAGVTLAVAVAVLLQPLLAMPVTV